MQPSSVTYLNNQIKSTIDSTFTLIYVSGEVSNLVNHSSGHSYFSIKDEFSSIKCVLFKGNKRNSSVFENGSNVEIKGAITVYTPRGEYQIICQSVSLFGHGNLYIQYENLKKELSQKGYFEEHHKKKLAKFVDRVALVTSKTGAVIEDMKNATKKRWPFVELCLLDTQVQGQNAIEDIVLSIKKADSMQVDVIVVARGGGSIEDLWAFNSKEVAEAIFECKTLVVSAIGHESDFLISDLVADVRAPTPSIAMELVLPDMREYAQYVDDLFDRFKHTMNERISNKQKEISFIKESIKSSTLNNKLIHSSEVLSAMANSFKTQMKYILNNKTEHIPNVAHLYKNIISSKISKYEEKIYYLRKTFEQYNPSFINQQGKALLLKDKKPTTLEDVLVNDTLTLKDKKHIVDTKIISKDTISSKTSS